MISALGRSLVIFWRVRIDGAGVAIEAEEVALRQPLGTQAGAYRIRMFRMALRSLQQGKAVLDAVIRCQCPVDQARQQEGCSFSESRIRVFSVIEKGYGYRINGVWQESSRLFSTMVSIDISINQVLEY